MRIASLCPSNTEIVAYLGLTDMLVAVDDYSDWPEAINTLPRLGPDLSIDLDKLEDVYPDLVLASLSVPGMEKNIAGLEERNIPYLILDPQGLEDIEKDLLSVAQALGEPEVGEKAANEFRKKIQLMQGVAKNIQSQPSIYWEWWPKPVFTPGEVNWLTEISELAGAHNLFRDQKIANVQTDWEDVRKRNPDTICLAWVGVRRKKVDPKILHKRPGWSALDAIKSNKVYVLEEELYCRPSPRLLEGAIKLAQLLHPEHYNQLDSSLTQVPK
ncbi:cobalamin-binding protein [Cytobacillus purgationiresistens]|uniref:Iron complex transport system substrate-binding protein n=1 Tax=Cytobacillus purgationiresistens TaxID=863449 RepID=A0ABU0AJE1_9BACI|nr:cobalamin-binding protein [Cytobacillus purgationiresistens]MDQ0270862.1 iron complex transport system substrate-binding protein [Cytobacillus purgationiresistens]